MGSTHSKYPSRQSDILEIHDSDDADSESAPLLPTLHSASSPYTNTTNGVQNRNEAPPPYVRDRNFQPQDAPPHISKHAPAHAHVDLTAWKETHRALPGRRQLFAGGDVYNPRCQCGDTSSSSSSRCPQACARPRPRQSNSYAVVLAAMISSLFVLWTLLASGSLCLGAASPSSPQGRDHSTSTKVTTSFAPAATQNNWGPYTPWYPAEKYTSPPSHCEVDQVNIIQRHGARFPTSGATTRFKAVVAKLSAAKSYDAELAFLANYSYTLGKDNLIPFGAFQSEESGKGAYTRYKHLVSKKNIPFVRASSGQRVVDSATNWTAGFSLASHGLYNPPLSVILSESANDTLDDNMCPNAGTSDAFTGAWASVFGAPIATRLNALAPGANLTAADIPNFMPLCAFETLVKETLSPFCKIFPASEWAQFEYWADLDKYYNTGYGQELGRVQGVGYVNELLARLTGTAVQDETQTNRTLDADPATFPLDRTVYADFSHDNQMIAIYAAMGLFEQSQGDLSTSEVVKGRSWIASRLTPFSARMVTERLTCRISGKGKKKEQFVRILVNDALQPLEFCGGDKHGLCTLSAFVDSQTYSRNNGEGDFQKCGVV